MAGSGCGRAPGMPSGLSLTRGGPAELAAATWRWSSPETAAQLATRTMLETELRRGRQLLWVLRDQHSGILGQVIAVLAAADPQLADGRDRAYLMALDIHPDHRGRGLGTLLLAGVLQRLWRRGLSAVTIGCDCGDHRLERFYGRLGFVRTVKILRVDPYWLDAAGEPRRVGGFKLLEAAAP